MYYDDSHRTTPSVVGNKIIKPSSSSSSSYYSTGYRLLISNLHPRSVSLEDIRVSLLFLLLFFFFEKIFFVCLSCFQELFGSIGPIKSTKFVDQGIAEVIFMSLEDAYAAINKYDDKELDGYPMRIKLTPMTDNTITKSSSTTTTPTNFTIKQTK